MAFAVDLPIHREHHGPLVLFATLSFELALRSFDFTLFVLFSLPYRKQIQMEVKTNSLGLSDWQIQNKLGATNNLTMH